MLLHKVHTIGLGQVRGSNLYLADVDDIETVGNELVVGSALQGVEGGGNGVGRTDNEHRAPRFDHTLIRLAIQAPFDHGPGDLLAVLVEGPHVEAEDPTVATRGSVLPPVGRPVTGVIVVVRTPVPAGRDVGAGAIDSLCLLKDGIRDAGVVGQITSSRIAGHRPPVCHVGPVAVPAPSGAYARGVEEGQPKALVYHSRVNVGPEPHVLCCDDEPGR